MTKEIIFVAGVHGVGKTTFCDELKTKLKIPSYSSSDLIKAYNSELEFPDKKIKEIKTNQDALLHSIQQNVIESRLLLDGHFVLLNKNGSIQKIPLETFQTLNPICIILLTENPIKIQNRLDNRGANNLSVDEIQSLQESEILYAKEVSTLLNINLHILENNEQKIKFINMGEI